jgi:hypothetical protein
MADEAWVMASRPLYPNHLTIADAALNVSIGPLALVLKGFDICAGDRGQGDEVAR